MRPKGEPHLSVVVPAHDEAERLPSTLERIARYLDEHAVAHEILVVDDGSRDDTLEIARRGLRDLPGRVLHRAERSGKGAAVRHGVSEAMGRWVLVTDADLSTPIEEHARLAAAARDRDRDVVIGSRAIPGSRVEIRQHPVREGMGKAFGAVVRAAMGLPFRDTQCGFKLFDRKRTKPLFDRMVIDGFAWDVELLFLCVQFGLDVEEVPVTWRNDPRSAVSPILDPPRMLLDLARIRWRFRRGGYNPGE
jgi:glycosyltransferase involved in cell wall biosynthesis